MDPVHVWPASKLSGAVWPRGGKKRRALNTPRRACSQVLNVERITEIFPCDADKRFVTNVKCPTGLASFWVKFPTVNSSQMPGVCLPGRWAVLVLTVTLFRILEFGFCVPFLKYENGL